MMDNPPDRMDPILDLLDQRPRENWAWSFDPVAPGESRTNAIALCNLSILTYSAQSEVRRFLIDQWKFDSFVPLHKNQGFVARRGEVLVIAFRGTQPMNAYDWISDVNYHQRTLRPGISGLIHGGFATALEEVVQPMLDAVASLSGAAKRLYVTGHSLGGALAILAATLLKLVEKQEVAGVYTYGQPRVADPEFASAYNQALGAVTFRYVNDLDVVPHVPPTRMPAKTALQGSSLKGLLGGLQNASREIEKTLGAVLKGQQFDHVGELRLFGNDGKLTADPLEWQKREVIYSGTFTELLQQFPQLLRAQFAQFLRGPNRLLHHDPVRGYLAKLEA